VLPSFRCAFLPDMPSSASPRSSDVALSNFTMPTRSSARTSWLDTPETPTIRFTRALDIGAYWLLHELRGAAPKRSIWRTATFETIRCAFLKIAVRIEELKTRIKTALPSAYPHVQALTALATSIAARAP